MTSPAFQFYVQDFLTGTMLLTAEEVGAYLLLLCYQWDKGALPNSDRDLQRIARVKGKVLEKVREKFELGEDGLLSNERMEKVRQTQLDYRASASKAGKASAEKRWGKNEKTAAEKVTTVTDPLPIRDNENVTLRLSASSSISNKAHTPLAFLKFKNEIALTDLKKNSTLSDEEWE